MRGVSVKISFAKYQRYVNKLQYQMFVVNNIQALTKQLKSPLPFRAERK